MSTIVQKDVYLFEGQEFGNLKTLRRHIEDKIGAILDKSMGTRLPPKIALAVHECIIKHRHELIKLLSAEIDLEIVENSYEKTVSIFEI